MSSAHVSEVCRFCSRMSRCTACHDAMADNVCRLHKLSVRSNKFKGIPLIVKTVIFNRTLSMKIHYILNYKYSKMLGVVYFRNLK